MILRDDLGQRMDLVASGRLVVEDAKCFPLQSDEDEYFMHEFDEIDRHCGYFKGLKELTATEREHFDKHLDIYLFYGKMVFDTSALKKAKEEQRWLVKRLKVV